MIIVSQDKTKTTESLELTIEANTVEKGEFPTTIIEITDYYILDRKNGIVLGDYKTKERVEEVLKDIVSRYEAIELCKKRPPEILGYTLADYTPVYEMPEE